MGSTDPRLPTLVAELRLVPYARQHQYRTQSDTGSGARLQDSGYKAEQNKLPRRVAGQSFVVVQTPCRPLGASLVG